MKIESFLNNLSESLVKMPLQSKVIKTSRNKYLRGYLFPAGAKIFQGRH